MEKIKSSYKGVLLCAVAAIPCWYLGKLVPVVGGPVFGVRSGGEAQDLKKCFHRGDLV